MRSLQQRPHWQVTLGVVFLAQLMTAVGFSMVFPFLPLYVQDLGSVTGMSVELMAGLVIGVQGFTMMVMSPVWGNLADRYGRKLMVMRSMFGGAVILAMMGWVRSGEELIILRAIQGMITGTIAANNALVAAAVPRNRVGFSMGLLQVGLWAGVALGPLMGGVLADAYGYNVPFFITALALLVSGVLVYVGVHEEFEPKPLTAGEKAPSMLNQWRHVLSAPGVSLVYTAQFLSSMGRVIIIPIAPLFVASLMPLGANAGLASGAVIAASSATATLSGVFLGRLGDRIGHRQVMFACASVAVLVYAPVMFVSAVWQLIALQALAGLCLGGVTSAPSALLARYTTPGEEGAVYGLDNAIVSGARAVAPIVGAGVAMLFGMRATFAAGAVTMLIVALMAALWLPQDAPAHQANPMPAAGD